MQKWLEGNARSLCPSGRSPGSGINLVTAAGIIDGNSGLWRCTELSSRPEYSCGKRGNCPLASQTVGISAIGPTKLDTGEGMGTGSPFSAWKRLDSNVLCGACWGDTVLETIIGLSDTSASERKSLIAAEMGGGGDGSMRVVGEGLGVVSTVRVASEGINGVEADLGIRVVRLFLVNLREMYPRGFGK